MKNIFLRPVELNHSDIIKLGKVGRKTFAETFLPFNSHSSIELYLERKFRTEQLIEELENPESQFYFAELEGNAVGYLKVNTGNAQTEKVLLNAMEIERIYVLSEFYGKKVGQQLFDLALKIANDRNVKFIWLGVWKKNQRAVRFYEKNGFVEFDKHIFMMGDKEQTDILMKRVLQ